MDFGLGSTLRVGRNLLLLAIGAALLTVWLGPDSEVAGPDPLYGMVVDPEVNAGQAVGRLGDVGVHTVRLRMDVKDWATPSANTGGTAYEGALDQAEPFADAGFRVVLRVNSEGGGIPSYGQARGFFQWLSGRPGWSSVDVVEVLGPVTVRASNADAFSTTLSLGEQARRYVQGPLKAAWDQFGGSDVDVLGAAFTLWEQTRDFSASASYNLNVTKAYVRAGYLRYVDYAGLQPDFPSPAGQAAWVRRAAGVLTDKPIWISEWRLDQRRYADASAYTAAMSDARNRLASIVAVDMLGYATFSDDTIGVARDALGGYRPRQPAYDTYRDWPKG